MTTVYFIRHAQSDRAIYDDMLRPLTQKGLADRSLVTKFLSDKNIDIILSSPYKRAIDTVSEFAQINNLPIAQIDDFRERKVSSVWINDFKSFAEKQWADFSHKLPDGESLADAQKRNIAALSQVLNQHKNKNIVIGTHGTALSTIINFYENSYGIKDFMAMAGIMPWVVKMSFDDNGCAGIEKIDLFNNQGADHSRCKVCTSNIGSLKAYRFVVVFARYNDKWLYCRAKKRNSYETAGGHIEPGESPLEAAKRELFEETGATRFDMTPAFDYSVHIPTAFSNGQVFFAKIHELGDIPDYEMAEVKLFDSIPDEMRFPAILPKLYKHMQGWINLQSNKGELWDVYDKDRNPTGRTHRRGDPLFPGDYHIIVHVCIMNSSGKFLITKRTPNKGFPNMWECTGGSALSGDDSITAALREVKEETGLTLSPENGVCAFTAQGDNYFCDVWFFRQDFDIADVVLQENETCDAKWASQDEICAMVATGEFIPFRYIDELFKKIADGDI